MPFFRNCNTEFLSASSWEIVADLVRDQDRTGSIPGNLTTSATYTVVPNTVPSLTLRVRMLPLNSSEFSLLSGNRKSDDFLDKLGHPRKRISPLSTNSTARIPAIPRKMYHIGLNEDRSTNTG